VEVYVKESKNVKFEKGQIVCACLTGTYVIKTFTILGVLRAAVYKIVLAYEDISEEERRQKEMDHCYTEKDFLEKSQNYCKHR
jgi:hypothetical protein